MCQYLPRFRRLKLYNPVIQTEGVEKLDFAAGPS